MNEKKHKQNLVIVLLVLVCSNVAVYGLPYMRSAFYNIMIEAMGLTNLEISRLWSIFGIVAMMSYILGGYIADVIPPKKLLIYTLIVSGILHLYFSTIPSYTEMIIIFGLMGITTVLVFYPASTKILACLGKGENQGKIFGSYYSLVGLLGIIITGIGFLLLNKGYGSQLVFCKIVRIYALLNFLSALGVGVLFKESQFTSVVIDKIKYKEIPSVIKNSAVWIVAGIMLSNYVIYSFLTYITPYLINIHNVSTQNALLVNIVRDNVITILAGPIFGAMVDKVGSAVKVIRIGLTISLICLTIILIFPAQKIYFIIILLNIMIFSMMVIGIKGVGIVLISEVKFPVYLLGTVIGIVSFIGYSPDAFFYPLSGIILDTLGNRGYSVLIIICVLFSILGINLCSYLKKINSYSK